MTLNTPTPEEWDEAARTVMDTIFSPDYCFLEWAKAYGGSDGLGYPSGDIFAGLGKPEKNVRPLPRIRSSATPASGVATIVRKQRLPHVSPEAERVERFMADLLRNGTYPQVYEALRHRYIDRMTFEDIARELNLLSRREASSLVDNGLAMFEGSCL